MCVCACVCVNVHVCGWRKLVKDCHPLPDAGQSLKQWGIVFRHIDRMMLLLMLLLMLKQLLTKNMNYQFDRFFHFSIVAKKAKSQFQHYIVVATFHTKYMYCMLSIVRVFMMRLLFEFTIVSTVISKQDCNFY